jgi:hypothetical protein
MGGFGPTNGAHFDKPHAFAPIQLGDGSAIGQLTLSRPMALNAQCY